MQIPQVGSLAGSAPSTLNLTSCEVKRQSVSGLSQKTQLLYCIIYCTRYLDLLDHRQASSAGARSTKKQRQHSDLWIAGWIVFSQSRMKLLCGTPTLLFTPFSNAVENVSAS